jgi:hypothetical protein
LTGRTQKRIIHLLACPEGRRYYGCLLTAFFE